MLTLPEGTALKASVFFVSPVAGSQRETAGMGVTLSLQNSFIQCTAGRQRPKSNMAANNQHATVSRKCNRLFGPLEVNRVGQGLCFWSVDLTGSMVT